MCIYGSIVTFRLFQGEIIEKDLFNATFFDATTGKEYKADRAIIFHYLVARHFSIASVLGLMFLMGLVLTLFLGFHLYISAKGMTTNEFYKWRHVKKFFKREQAKARKAREEAGTQNFHEQSAYGSEKVLDFQDGDVGCAGPMKSDNIISKDDNIMSLGEIPINIYNQGIVENFKEIIFPRSLRKDALNRWKQDMSKTKTLSNGSKDESMDKLKHI